MFKSLFKSLITKNAVKTAAVSIPLHPVAKEGESRLQATKLKLSELRDAYSKGKFSGHPEDMLEMIEDYESIERTQTKAKKRGWVPDEAVISEIREDIEKQKEYMKGKSYPQSAINNEILWRSEKLEEALLGLR